jgi:transcriptional regulator with XRE-family HTH domain
MVTKSIQIVDFFGKSRIFVRMTDEELARIIGGNVRSARASAGLTQAALGEKSGIAVPHISRLEAGTHLPSVTTLKRVADVLEVPICSLLDPPPSPGDSDASTQTGQQKKPRKNKAG